MTHSDHKNMQEVVGLHVDPHGFFGRECPKCKKYFKVLPCTGRNDISSCFCPYCGYEDSDDEFFTEDQAKRMKTAALNVAADQIMDFLRNGLKPYNRPGMNPPMRIKDGAPYQLHVYSEKDLETLVECTNCSLIYEVYGVFAFCPDCGQHNSLQIFEKNLEVISKNLMMAESADEELKQQIIESSMDKCISNFDGFGRELWKIFANDVGQNPIKSSISFQNLNGANTKFQKQFNIELKSGISDEEWRLLIQYFQRRHLFSHNMGVIDQEYINKTGDSEAVIGRKIIIHAEEVRGMILILIRLANFMYGTAQSSKIDCSI